MATTLSVSIIVPARDEEDGIDAVLGHLTSSFPDCELVVADGGSRDRTVERARRWARVVSSRPGRGPQLNAGAAAATGEVLWFVHADTVVDPDALPALRAALADGSVAGGGCRLRFDRASRALRWLEWTTHLRARHLHWIFGDQAMFVRRSVFDDVGGFPDIPIMEDLEMSRRLHRRGRLVVLDTPSTASARRFVEHGTTRMIVRMQWFKLQYFLGVDPARIREQYDAARGRG